MQKSRTITLNLLHGNPFGVKLISFSNRLILWLSFSRKDFEIAKTRKECDQSGVYFLIGQNENNDSVVYIWQATKLIQRLSHHYQDTDKDFWNQAIVFTTRDDSLKETDINFLERELIKIAKGSDRFMVYNKTAWNNCLADEFKIDDLRDFIDDLKILLSSLGFHILQDRVAIESTKKKYFCKRKEGTMWMGYYTEEGFLVLKWSKWVSVNQAKYLNVYNSQQRFLSEHIIEKQDDSIVFLKDYLFLSPSAASWFLNGMNSNGWFAWQDENWKTLSDNERV